MAGLDLTSFAEALKVHYGDQKLVEIAAKRRPFLSLVPKNTKFTGRSKPFPTKFANSHNRSAQLIASQRSASGDPGMDSAALAEFLLTTTKKNYGAARIEREAILASADDKGSFAKAVTTAMDAAVDSLADDVWGSLYRSGTGSRGQIASVAGPVYTLTNREDIYRFEVGMAVQFSNGVETNALRTAGTALSSVIGVDRSAGSFTLDTAISSGTTNDHVFAYGDRIGGALTAPAQYLKIAGLAGWLPTAAPGSTAWFGVDRSRDTDKLGGVRYDGRADSYEEALISAGVEVERLGGDGDHVFMNPTDVRKFVFEMGSRVERSDRYDSAKVGFSALKVITGHQVLDVIADTMCPKGIGYMLTMDTWSLESRLTVPHIVMDDGLKMIREDGADGFKIRLASYSELMCTAPGRNAVIQLPV